MCCCVPRRTSYNNTYFLKTLTIFFTNAIAKWLYGNERVGQELLGYTAYFQMYTWLRHIFREPCFFVLPSWETDTQQIISPLCISQRDLSTLSTATPLGSKTSIITHISQAPTHFSHAVHVTFLLSLVYLKTKLQSCLFF